MTESYALERLIKGKLLKKLLLIGMGKLVLRGKDYVF